MARWVLGTEPVRATVGLHGSFAATGIGHATDRALVCGLLGWGPDDERLKDALTLAPQHGLDVKFETVDLGEEVHPNSAHIVLEGRERQISMLGSSVGGGAIVTTRIDDYPTEIRGQLETLVMWHEDTPGFLARIVSVCACVDMNIASVRTSRRGRGQESLTTLEVDGSFAADVLSVLRRGHGVRLMAHLPVLPGF